MRYSMIMSKAGQAEQKKKHINGLTQCDPRNPQSPTRPQSRKKSSPHKEHTGVCR